MRLARRMLIGQNCFFLRQRSRAEQSRCEYRDTFIDTSIINIICDRTKRRLGTFMKFFWKFLLVFFVLLPNNKKKKWKFTKQLQNIWNVHTFLRKVDWSILFSIDLTAIEQVTEFQTFLILDFFPSCCV